jgi:dCTP deaminase
MLIRSFPTQAIVDALRSAGNGQSVAIFQFLKGGIDQGPDCPRELTPNLLWYRSARPHSIDPTQYDEADQLAVQALWVVAKNALRTTDYVVFEELDLAIAYGLIPNAEVVLALSTATATITIAAGIHLNSEEPMLKSDAWITQAAEAGMITPFVPELMRRNEDDGAVISYGLSSYGYDLRLSPQDFRIFHRIPGAIIDPKNFRADNLEDAPLQSGEDGDYFILPAHSYALGVALEKLSVPNNVTVLCIGKSTYARIGVIANMTPAEAGWRGHLTLEFSNSSSADCRVYANEGVVQLLFLEGDPCNVTYDDRAGKYQDQAAEVTLARV